MLTAKMRVLPSLPLPLLPLGLLLLTYFAAPLAALPRRTHTVPALQEALSSTDDDGSNGVSNLLRVQMIPGPPVMCNPKASKPQRCPGGIKCPQCGKAACVCPAHGPHPSPAPPDPHSINCNPKASKPQMCPGGIKCPQCGKTVCPCPAGPAPAPPHPSPSPPPAPTPKPPPPSPPTPTPTPPSPAPSPAPPPPPSPGSGGRMQWHQIAAADATCLMANGTQPAGVYVKVADPTRWVIALGDLVADLETTLTPVVDGVNMTSSGMEQCVDEIHCEVFAKTVYQRPSTRPLGGGIQSTDCKQNPTFCKFSQAQLPSCDMALWMGAHDYISKNGIPLKFRGLKVLDATIKLLGTLQLNKAQQVVLTGFNQGGTAVLYHADRLGDMIRQVAPGLKIYKALPCDALHPAHSLLFFAGLNLQVLFAQNQDPAVAKTAAQTNSIAATAPACRAAHPGAEWMCLLTNETLKYGISKTPLFLAQQLMAVWDTKCGVLDGLVTAWGSPTAPTPTLNQIICDPPGNAWPENVWEWNCFNSAQHSAGKPADFHQCTAAEITTTVIPYQQQYLDEYTKSGLAAKPGNGGFFHSCWAGASWGAYTATTSYWNELSIGGVTMQQAITKWWEAPATATATLTKDCLWTAGGTEHMCNPVCKALLPCPSGQVWWTTQGQCRPTPPPPPAPPAGCQPEHSVCSSKMHCCAGLKCNGSGGVFRCRPRQEKDDEERAWLPATRSDDENGSSDIQLVRMTNAEIQQLQELQAVWSGPIMCNPKAAKPQLCPGGIKCPQCGKTACVCPAPGPPKPPPTPTPPTPPTPPKPPAFFQPQAALEVHPTIAQKDAPP